VSRFNPLNPDGELERVAGEIRADYEKQGLKSKK
jgi:hypothetical protein